MFVETLIIGRVGNIRVNEVNGQSVANVSVATSRKRGEQTVTTWWDVALWGTQAEIPEMVQLKKGDAVVAKGMPDATIFEKNGRPTIQHKLTANIFYKTGESREAGQEAGNDQA